MYTDFGLAEFKVLYEAGVIEAIPAIWV
ncbi:hypothetical protein EPICR_250003 [Candidatus Desulfarcum epimagneticum]|uniref:Uncharacterized protein n=1 Tax=uncultured Desulfobacteraceae bacterium TaxID=218296 RepID=A0A484HHX1_9BACT|nr:hypothetical protein EPICR_250003 [uncultured Desulfobacteraceae bacterium]